LLKFFYFYFIKIHLWSRNRASFLFALLSESINENFNILKENKYLKAKKGLNISLEKYLKDFKHLMALKRFIIAIDKFLNDFIRLLSHKINILWLKKVLILL